MPDVGIIHDAKVVIGGVDLSAFSVSARITRTYRMEPNMAMGDDAESNLKTIPNDTITIEGINDDAAGGPMATLVPIFDSKLGTATITLAPSNEAVATDNPYMPNGETFAMASWDPCPGAAHGILWRFSATFVSAGSIGSRAIA